MRYGIEDSYDNIVNELIRMDLGFTKLGVELIIEDLESISEDGETLLIQIPYIKQVFTESSFGDFLSDIADNGEEVLNEYIKSQDLALEEGSFNRAEASNLAEKLNLNQKKEVLSLLQDVLGGYILYSDESLADDIIVLSD